MNLSRASFISLPISQPAIVCIRAVDLEKNGETFNLPLTGQPDGQIGAGELFKFDETKVFCPSAPTLS